MEIYGDVRWRYEYRAGNGGNIRNNRPTPIAGENTQNEIENAIVCGSACAARWRTTGFLDFALRRAPIRDPPTSPLATTRGPFGKASDCIGVGQAYLGYSGFRDIRLTAGKMPNPFVTTLMVWDGDINPEGLAEQWKHYLQSLLRWRPHSGGLRGKDGKSVAPVTSSEPTRMTIDMFANFGQFVYDDANPENPLGPRGSRAADWCRTAMRGYSAGSLARS